jgi:ABC-type multidrug transport system permease subunit
MRRRGQLKRLAATPMRRSDFLVSVFLSRLVFLAMEVVALLAFGSLVFGVALSGPLLALGAVALLGAAAFAAISLVIAARTESIEAATGWLNFVMLPMWLLSGTFFSYERFPEVLHPALRALPLTALNDGLRSIVNEGAGLRENLWVVGVLALWVIVPSLFAHRAFRWGTQ